MNRAQVAFTIVAMLVICAMVVGGLAILIEDWALSNSSEVPTPISVDDLEASLRE